MFNDFLHLLPSFLNTKFGVSIRKIVKIITDCFTNFSEFTKNLSTKRYIQTATGKDLDKLGKEYGVTRQGLSDDVYRIFIKIKIFVANNSDTTESGLLKLISYISNVKLNDLASTEINLEEPLVLNIKNIPISTISDTKQINLFRLYLQKAVACGVHIKYLSFLDSQNEEIRIYNFEQTQTTYNVKEV